MISQQQQYGMRYARKIESRLRVNMQSLKINGILALKKFEEECPQLLKPYKSQEWRTQIFQGDMTIQVLPMIFEALVEKIYFDKIIFKYTNIVNIPKQLTYTKFHNLTELILSNNFIVTIEPFITISAAKLKILDLSKNSITFLKSLRKCFFPLLEIVDFRMNPIVWYDGLSEMGQKQLKQLRIHERNIFDSRDWWYAQRLPYNEKFPDLLRQPFLDINFRFKMKKSLFLMFYPHGTGNSLKRKMLDLLRF